MSKLLIIDLSAVFWWKWFASAGGPVDEAYEYTVGKVVSLASAGYDYVAIALDIGSSFRSEVYPLYKANRPPRDQAAVAQIMRVRAELERRGFLLLSAAGFEADDVIATVVEWASRSNSALEVVIAGSDKDLFQLVSSTVTVLGLQTDTLVDEAGVMAKLGVMPSQIRDYLALVGDAADNVRGVPGIGPVKAKALLARYDSLDHVIEQIETVEPASVRKALQEHRAVLDLARQLVALRTDAPIDCERILATNRIVAEGIPVDLPRPQTNGVKQVTMTTSNGGPRFGAASVTRELDASPHKFILTGRSGVGKTFFLSTIPDVFIIPIEEGLKGASPDHDPPRFRAVPRTLTEFFEALDAFEALNAPVDGKRPYRHLAIDSLAGVETLVHQHLQTEARVTSMEGKDYQKMWREIEPQFLKIQARLDLLRRRQGTHVWLSAHSAEVIDASSVSGETYRKWDLLLRAPGQIGAELRNLWRGWADHVLFIDWSMSVGKKNKGARTIGTIRGRVLYTAESGTHYAKTRSRLPPSLPATYADLATALKRGVSATDAKLRTSLESLLAQLDEESITALGETHAATGNALAALVSRAQGMLSVAREDTDAPEVESAPIEAGAP